MHQQEIDQSIFLLTMQAELIKFPFCMVQPRANNNNNFKWTKNRSAHEIVVDFPAQMKNHIFTSATSAWRPTTQRTPDKTESVGEQLQSSGLSSVRRRLLTDESFNVIKVNQIFITGWINHTRSLTKTIRRLIRTGSGT